MNDSSIKSPAEISGRIRAFEGFVQAINHNLIAGWAFDRNLPNSPMDVDIYIDSALATSLTADIFGADLHWAGIWNGHHRWYYDLSKLVSDDTVHVVNVRFGGSEREFSVRTVQAWYADLS